MHLYVDVHGEYWVGSEEGVMFVSTQLPASGLYFEAEVWDFDEATNKYDLELVQEAGG